MSVNSSSTFEFSINQLVRIAYIMASQMAPEEPAAGVQWDARVQFGYSCLELIMKGLEAEGKLSRTRRFVQVQLAEGVNSYALDDDVMDVIEDAAFIPPGQTPDTADGQTPVKPMDLESWNRLTSKASSGRPNLYFCYRAAAPLVIKVWPVPSAEDEGLLQLQAVKFLAQNNDGTKVPDLERYWNNYLVHRVAAMIAEAANEPTDKVMRLEAKAEQQLLTAKKYSRQSTPATVVVTHRSGYGGYRR